MIGRAFNQSISAALAQRLKGAVKEVVGRATGDVALERQGRRDQRESHLTDAGEKIKGAFRPRGPHGRQTKARRDLSVRRRDCSWFVAHPVDSRRSSSSASATSMDGSGPPRSRAARRKRGAGRLLKDRAGNRLIGSVIERAPWDLFGVA